MTENEYLKATIKTFLDIVEFDRETADKIVEGYDDFYNFVENNEKLKENMYKFFYKMLNNYIIFRFYTEPIPALIENKEYMRKFKQNVLKQANTFFNYGGFL